MGVELMQAGSAALADRAGVEDDALVAAVRRGDDRAFEELYGRYHARITGFVNGKVHDHARAEDITQDVFVSALRRMRATTAPIAFRPWIYEIARNACIDAYRRGRRAEQVPLESERLAPADRERLVAGDPAPEAAMAVKEELDHLRGAFGSLSDAHHEILVLREFEGLSYEAIGEQLGLSKAGVESTLFRARRRLGEEFEDLESGERCVSVQTLVAESGDRRLGVRDRRRVMSHAAHCDACRRVARLAGFEVDVPRRRRVARRLGGWLPIPAFLRRGGEQVVTAVGGRGGWMAHLPGLVEPGWGKAAAGVAAAVALAGAGAGVTASRSDSQAPPPAAPAVVAAAPTQAADAGQTVRRGAAAPTARAIAPAAKERVARKDAPAKARRDAPARADGGADRAPAREGGSDAGDGRGGDTGAGGGSQPVRDTVERTREPVRDTVDRTREAVRDTREVVRDTVDRTSDTVRNTVDQTNQAVQQVPEKVGGAGNNVNTTVENASSNAGSTVGNAVQNVQQTATQPANVVPNATDTANDAVNDVSNTANDAVDDAANTVGGLLGP